MPSLWAIQVVVIGLLVRALTPPNVTIADLERQKHDTCHRLAEAKRKRRRQKIFPPQGLT